MNDAPEHLRRSLPERAAPTPQEQLDAYLAEPTGDPLPQRLPWPARALDTVRFLGLMVLLWGGVALVTMGARGLAAWMRS